MLLRELELYRIYLNQFPFLDLDDDLNIYLQQSHTQYIYLLYYMDIYKYNLILNVL